LAREIVRGKLLNQRAMLFTRQRHLKDEAVAGALSALRAAAGRLDHVTDIDALRGHEGMGAQRYFSVFPRALANPAFRFEGRNRYPPRDPVNACLSFGYTLLLTRCESAVRIAGLDPYAGSLHEADRGAPALALDLMEEFRPWVDRTVLSLINRGQLGPEDFRTPPEDELGERADNAGADQAVYLNRVAREILLRAWQGTLAAHATHPIRGDRWVLHDLIGEQATQLARVFEGRQQTYQPVRM